MGPTFLKSELFVIGYDKNLLERTKLHITWDAPSLILILPGRGRRRGLLMACYCGSSSHGMLHRSYYLDDEDDYGLLIACYCGSSSQIL